MKSHPLNPLFTALLTTALLALLLLAGCGSPPAGEPQGEGPASGPQAGAPANAGQAPGAALEAPAGMRGTQPPAPPGSPQPPAREITDMAGRVMTVPGEITSIFPTLPVAAIYIYTLAPDLLLGWNVDLNETERSVILPQYHSLPNFGMGDAVNYEAVIAAAPSLVLNVVAINEGTIDQSDKMAASLGAPVAMVSTRLEDAPEAYRFLGELLGLEGRAEALASYAEATFRDIDRMAVPEGDKARIYYGNGEDSLETAPPGSSSGQIIEMVKGVNAADLEAGDGSRIRISPEQLLAWDPDVIIVNGEPRASLSGGTAAQAILANKDYASLKAVQNGKVFGAPNAPFSWIDRPVGPNRLVGIRWLAKKIYPAYFDYDADDEVREFYRLFYHVELSDEKLAEIYHGSR